MRKEIRELFEAVREEASRHAWSRGVELARSQAVVREASSGPGIALRVFAPGERVGRLVVLDPEACDWSCECPATDGACMHAAAAVIAAKRAFEEGREIAPAAERNATVGYRFRRAPDGLHLSRVLVRQGEEIPLTKTLGAIVAGKVEGPPLSVTEEDLAIDGRIGTKLEGWFPREVLEPILRLLVGKSDIRLDGEPVEVRAERRGLVVRLEDQADGFRLDLVQDPSVDEIFANGVVRCGNALALLAQPDLSAREMEILRRGRRFGPDEILELVTEVLPYLEGKLPIERKTARLPRAERLVPRIEVHTEREGDALSVLPTVVYGDPPVARLVGDKLVHLGGPVPIRDPEAERRLQRRLQENFGLHAGHRLRLAAAEAISLVRRLETGGIGLRGEGHAHFTLAPPIEPWVGVEGTRLGVRFRSGSGEAAPDAVLRAWRGGESLVPLLDGGFAPLPKDWLDRHGALLADLLAARAPDGRVPASSLPDLGRLCEALDLPPPPELDRLRPLLEDFSGLPSPELPTDLRVELRPYQREGVAWLSFLRAAGLGGLLADDMGLGKTLQAACVLEPGSLVVAPTSVLPNWVAELRRFRPALRVSVYHGPSRRLDPDADVTLTTYAILRLDADRLAARRWRTVVLDEAQAIKNPESQVAQAAYRLSADFRLCLTGTPVENRLDELWSQFHFLARGFLGGRRDFQERYAQPIAEGHPGVAERLRQRIRPFVLRRRKQDVARELPPRTDLVLRFALDEREREVYEALRAATAKEVVAQLAGPGDAGMMAALEALLRLRQAACHIGLLPGQHAERSSKVALLLERLEQAVGDGHKALVFSQWTGLLDRVEPGLRAAGIDFLRLDGSTRDRGEVVASFQAESGPPVLLATLKAGGTGLNLTAADHVFLLDPWWNPAAEDQAADRAHRIGQERPVFVHRLVAEGTVEDRILELQERKRQIAEAAIGDATAAASLTREDLLELLA